LLLLLAAKFQRLDDASDLQFLADWVVDYCLEFRIVNWNLNGLNSDSDSVRLTLAEQAFRSLANLETTVFTLVELGSELVLAHLADTLGSEWGFLYGSSSEARGGIGLLFRGDRVSATLLDPVTEPHYPRGKSIKIGRECAAIYQIKCITGREFLLAIVHFKSRERSVGILYAHISGYLASERVGDIS
jgi:hypothetical protein